MSVRLVIHNVRFNGPALQLQPTREEIKREKVSFRDRDQRSKAQPYNGAHHLQNVVKVKGKA